MIQHHYTGEFDVVSKPEFLREGQAVNNCLHPDRIVVSNAGPRAKQVMEKLYQPLATTILFTDVRTAEMIKYASNRSKNI